MNHQRLSEVLRFSAAQELRYGTGLTELAGTLAYQAAHGENTPLHALADLFEEHDHPAADLLRRAAAGEGEGDWLDHAARAHESVRIPTEKRQFQHVPYHYAVLPVTNEGISRPTRASVEVQYHNHPTGHHFVVHLRTGDPHPTRNRDYISRSFRLPVSGEQVRDFAERLKGSNPEDDTAQHDADHILRTLEHNTHPTAAEHFAKSVRRAILPHSETTASFLKLLQQNHSDLLDTSGNNNNRLIAADHFDEIGRHGEAGTLRSTDPIGIHDDRIWSGNLQSLPEVAREYIRSALWSSIDDRGDPLDDRYGPSDLHPSAVAKMHADAVQFHEKHGRESDPADLFGHYYWLSRNGHGTGFRDHPEHFGDTRSEKLHDKASREGEADLYVGDDDQIYHHPS